LEVVVLHNLASPLSEPPKEATSAAHQ
jgi:hypothetical protein